jgi:hypothetical protein
MNMEPKRKLGRKRPKRRISVEATLLPATVDSIQPLLMQAYIALKELSMGEGSKERLIELFRVLYMSWFLREAGIGNAETALYLRCNDILADIAIREKRERIWILPSEDVFVLQEIQFAYAGQMSQASIALLKRCELQIQMHFQRNSGPPWPSA